MTHYSIIIPHKNCFNLLLRCLESIPERDDIQIIVIDDNSNADIVNKISTITKKNTTFFLNKKPLGAGGARNIGLKHAIGEWLIFADADDFFTTDAFKIMDQHLNSHADIIFFAHEARFSDTLMPTERLGKRLFFLTQYHQKKDIESEEYLRYRNHSPTAKMIKHNLVRSYDIEFDEVPASNDAMFSILTGFYAKKIDVDLRICYCTTIRQNSITQTKSRTNAFARYNTDIKIYNFFRKHNLTHLYPYVTAEIARALINYGWKEFFRYLKLANENHINIWLGITKRIEKIRLLFSPKYLFTKHT